ncbi:hypothetical protein CYLTODRAFT_423322 [Cylindrobasidium torrendii FP15055 ss-10]|uniref:Translocon-associated protein subunit alpha n=1 Tax=Cylindrobasidium torrendii FP15055 ss-10 TaxID=1314674 RepID=A0A0D7B8F8_9AGAR|nr:hypothetical protein CYLTODRAFT_423322 [Cylindrobasidium torrendii FP15055 ss-10]
MQLLSALVSLALFFQVSFASSAETEPEVSVVAAWPDSNPFGHVVNGERNIVLLTIESKSDQNLTLVNMAGSITHPESGALVKNLTASPFNIPLLEGVAMQLPYTFYSEFKTGDHRLNIWLENQVEGGEKYTVSAFDSIVTVVEPELSVFDFKMISTYLIVLAIFGGIGYIAYLQFVPQPKKVKRIAVSEPVGTVTATGAGGYQEEWIPDHHIRKTKGKKTGATSGDELSGGETSGTEGKRRKGKK